MIQLVPEAASLIAAAQDPLAMPASGAFRALTPDVQFKLLAWVQLQYGALKHWREADLDLALHAMRTADAERVERTHQARLRRLTDALCDNLVVDRPVAFCAGGVPLEELMCSQPLCRLARVWSCPPLPVGPCLPSLLCCCWRPAR